MNHPVQVQAANGPSIDAFGRWRVSTPDTQFDSQFQYGANPLDWESVLTGAGTATHLSDQSSIKMTCSTASGDKVVRQTKRYFRYKPGKSQLLFLTGVLGDAKANVRKRVGYFDGENGVYFEQTENDFKVVVRSKASGAVVNNEVSRSRWSNDSLDGSGPSQLSINFAKAQIFVIDAEWLGVGRVRVGVVSPQGEIIYFHEFHHANNTTSVYTSTFNLPVRYEIENLDTTASDTDMIQICSTVISEGGSSVDSGQLWAVGNGITPITVTTRRSVLSIRPKLTFNSAVNRAFISPIASDVLVSSADTIYWEVVKGGTLGGTPSWTSVNDESAVEYDIAGTTVTGGQVIAAGYADGSNANSATTSANFNFSASGLTANALTLNAAGNASEVFSIVATNFVADGNVHATLQWLEVK